jgi:hypothetical protein
MFYTTYFAKAKKLDPNKLISISRKTPEGFPGRKFITLSPTPTQLWNYKETGDEEQLTKAYKEHLETLDPHYIAEQSGDGAIFVCYEGLGKFCHRHIFANWMRSYGYDMEELLN